MEDEYTRCCDDLLEFMELNPDFFSEATDLFAYCITRNEPFMRYTKVSGQAQRPHHALPRRPLQYRRQVSASTTRQVPRRLWHCTSSPLF